MQRELDSLRRFVIESAGVRGVIVRLDSVWQQIQSRTAYPPVVANLLGELSVASALFAGDIKFAGSVSVQLRAPGNFEIGFAECTNEGSLRGLMRWKEPVPERLNISDLGQGAILAITIERDSGHRYQGLVPLECDQLSQVFEQYFAQSEQLPTAIRIAVTPNCAAGMLIQHVASEGGIKSDPQKNSFEDLSILFSTVRTDELLEIDSVTLLRRLFAEEDIRVMSSQDLQFRCRCSRTKVEAVFRQIGREEAFSALQENGYAEVICEFCDQKYQFDSVDLELLFTQDPSLIVNPREH